MARISKGKQGKVRHPAPALFPTFVMSSEGKGVNRWKDVAFAFAFRLTKTEKIKKSF